MPKLRQPLPEQITIHNCHGAPPAHYAWVEVKAQDGSVAKVSLGKLPRKKAALARVAYDLLCLLAAELEGVEAEAG